MRLRVICTSAAWGPAWPESGLEDVLAVAGVGGVEVDAGADDLVDEGSPLKERGTR